jgi:hypothetical protein
MRKTSFFNNALDAVYYRARSLSPDKKTNNHINKVGRCALDNPELPTDFVKALLISKETDRNLAEPFTFDEPDDK